MRVIVNRRLTFHSEISVFRRRCRALLTLAFRVIELGAELLLELILLVRHLVRPALKRANRLPKVQIVHILIEVQVVGEVQELQRLLLVHLLALLLSHRPLRLHTPLHSCRHVLGGSLVPRALASSRSSFMASRWRWQKSLSFSSFCFSPSSPSVCAILASLTSSCSCFSHLW